MVNMSNPTTLGDAEISSPDTATADTGTVRIGDCMVSADYSDVGLIRPDAATTDAGTVRQGDCMISAIYG